MKNRFFTEQELGRIFENDSKNIAPDSAIQERLEYTFMVKSAKYKIAQNSFSGMFGWLFSWHNIPAKAALVSVILFFSLMNYQPGDSQFISPGCDTTLNTLPFKIDSSGMLPFYADTCLNVKS